MGRVVGRFMAQIAYNGRSRGPSHGRKNVLRAGSWPVPWLKERPMGSVIGRSMAQETSYGRSHRTPYGPTHRDAFVCHGTPHYSGHGAFIVPWDVLRGMVYAVGRPMTQLMGRLRCHGSGHRTVHDSAHELFCVPWDGPLFCPWDVHLAIRRPMTPPMGRPLFHGTVYDSIHGGVIPR